MKYMSLACVILALCCYFLFSALTDAKKEIGTLESEKKALNNVVKGYQNAEVESNRTIRNLRERIESNKESFDWYNTRVPIDVRDELRKRHNRSRKN